MTARKPDWLDGVMVLTGLDQPGGRFPLKALATLVRRSGVPMEEIADALEARDCVRDGDDVLRLPPLPE